MGENIHQQQKGVTGMKQPCARDCPDRVAGCATTCEKWKAYVEERNAGYEERLRNNDFESAKRVVIDRAERRLWVNRKK